MAETRGGERLRGRVVWRVSSEGIPGVQVEALLPSSTRVEQWTTTDKQGEFELGGLLIDRTYLIRAVIDRARRDLGRVTIARGETRRTFEVEGPGGPTMPNHTSTTTATTDSTTTSGTSSATTGTTSDSTTTGTSSATTGTTDSTTTGTTTSGTTSDSTTSGTTSDSTTTGTTTSGTTTSDSTTTGTTTSGTTTTVAPGQPDDFDALLGTLRDPKFGPVPPVNVNDAREFRRLYTVGLYVLAGLPTAMARLRAALNQSIPGLPLVGKDTLISNGLPAEIEKILTYSYTVVEPATATGGRAKTNEIWLLEQVRRQFDLGTETAAGVNTEFKTLFRDFVNLCADDLMGVDPDTVKPGGTTVVVDARQYESVINFLKRVKRSLMNLVQSMSVYGTLGTRAKVVEWSGHVNSALAILRSLEDHVATDDSDEKHYLSILGALIGTPRAQLRSHVVHAIYGGYLLETAIEVYQQIGTDLTNEDPDYLRKLFHDKTARTYLFPDQPGRPGETAAQVLKSRAGLIRDNWLLPGWS